MISADNTVYLLDGEGHLVEESFTFSPLSVAISPDGSLVAVGSSDNKLYLFDSRGINTWTSVLDGTVNGVALSSDGDYAVAGTSNSKVYAFSFLPPATPTTPPATPTTIPPPVWNVTPENTPPANTPTPTPTALVTETATVTLTPGGPSMEPGSPAFIVVVVGILLGLTALVIAGMYFFRKR